MEEKNEDWAAARVEAAARAGARPSVLTVMCSAGGGSVAAGFAWPSGVLDRLSTPRGRCELCLAVETELDGWLASIEAVPSTEGLCAKADLSLKPTGLARGDTKSLKAMSQARAPWDEAGWAKLARVLDEMFGGPSLRGRYDLTFGSMGLLSKADELFAYPVNALKGVGPALALGDFCAQLESQVQAKALGDHTPSPQEGARSPRL